ncbi:MAG: hypothetical protein ACRDL7_08715, partial [Gaiellaceae bacterium]
RTVTPTRSGTPATPTRTVPGVATATPTPVPTVTGSPITSARLVSGISATATTISLDNANVFPSSGTIRIDTEQIAYGGKLGNTLLDVQRGVNHSTAAAHASGALAVFVSATVPTLPRPTPTDVPRGVVYQVVSDGSGCAVQTERQGSDSVPLVLVVGLALWVLRRRDPR